MEDALSALTGSFTSSTQSNAFVPGVGQRSTTNAFNITLSNTFTATVALERQFPNTSAWYPVTYPDGTAVAWTTPVSTSWEDPEQGVSYRLNCTYTSGTVDYRISQ